MANMQHRREAGVDIVTEDLGLIAATSEHLRERPADYSYVTHSSHCGSILLKLLQSRSPTLHSLMPRHNTPNYTTPWYKDLAQPSGGGGIQFGSD